MPGGDFSDLVRLSLLYENLYYQATQSSAPNKLALQKTYIHQAVERYAGALTVSTLNKQDKIDKINALIRNLNSLKDFDSFNW